MKFIEIPAATAALAKRRTADMVRAYKRMKRDDLEYLAMSAYVQGLNDGIDSARPPKQPNRSEGT